MRSCSDSDGASTELAILFAGTAATLPPVLGAGGAGGGGGTGAGACCDGVSSTPDRDATEGVDAVVVVVVAVACLGWGCPLGSPSPISAPCAGSSSHSRGGGGMVTTRYVKSKPTHLENLRNISILGRRKLRQ